MSGEKKEVMYKIEMKGSLQDILHAVLVLVRETKQEMIACANNNCTKDLDGK